MTYHLLKAGRWVQQGGWVAENAPDAWSYYEYFPPGGDLFWAWAMLPGHSDTLLAVAGGLVWLTCLLAGYGAARAFDGSRKAALGHPAVFVPIGDSTNLPTRAFRVVPPSAEALLSAEHAENLREEQNPVRNDRQERNLAGTIVRN